VGPPGPFLLRPYLLGGYGDSHNQRIAESAHKLPTIFDFGFSVRSVYSDPRRVDALAGFRYHPSIAVVRECESDKVKTPTIVIVVGSFRFHDLPRHCRLPRGSRPRRVAWCISLVCAFAAPDTVESVKH
jgi:hypothetical protein